MSNFTYPESATKEPDKLSFSGASKNSMSESLSLCIFLLLQKQIKENYGIAVRSYICKNNAAIFEPRLYVTQNTPLRSEWGTLEQVIWLAEGNLE